MKTGKSAYKPTAQKKVTKDKNHYRGILLSPVTYKIFSSTLLTTSEAQVDYQIGEYQGGFRKGGHVLIRS